MKYRHTPEMGEISGFGGGYEEGCQDMLEAGCEWLAEHKDADLKMHTYQDIYGILEPDSDDAKELSRVVGNACGECTGAMHQAVMTRLHYIAGNGWDKYAAELSKDA